MAWQFNRPESGAGIVQLFRRPECTCATANITLRGLDPKTRYEVTNFDISPAGTMTGRELMEDGLEVTIAKQPGAAILMYQPAKPQATIRNGSSTRRDSSLKRRMAFWERGL